MSISLKRRAMIAATGAMLALAVTAGPSIAADDDHDHDHDHDHSTPAASTMPTFTG